MVNMQVKLMLTGWTHEDPGDVTINMEEQNQDAVVGLKSPMDDICTFKTSRKVLEI